MRIARGKQNRMAFFFEHIAKLSRSSCFTRALKTTEHDDMGCSITNKRKTRTMSAQKLRELIKYDSHDTLRRGKRLEYLV